LTRANRLLSEVIDNSTEAFGYWTLQNDLKEWKEIFASKQMETPSEEGNQDSGTKKKKRRKRAGKHRSNEYIGDYIGLQEMVVKRRNEDKSWEQAYKREVENKLGNGRGGRRSICDGSQEEGATVGNVSSQSGGCSYDQLTLPIGSYVGGLITPNHYFDGIDRFSV
jgi:hypothetical protein